MDMNKTARLSADLLAKKGNAAPADKKVSPDYYKSLTVKLDRERYEALKTMGLKLDKKSQQILVEALDAWLLANHWSK
jgi:hypothetical protein